MHKKNMTQFMVKIQNQLHIFLNICKIFNCYEIEKGKYWLQIILKYIFDIYEWYIYDDGFNQY